MCASHENPTRSIRRHGKMIRKNITRVATTPRPTVSQTTHSAHPGPLGSSKAGETPSFVIVNDTLCPERWTSRHEIFDRLRSLSSSTGPQPPAIPAEERSLFPAKPSRRARLNALSSCRRVQDTTNKKAPRGKGDNTLTVLTMGYVERSVCPEERRSRKMCFDA